MKTVASGRDNVLAVGEWSIEQSYVLCPGNVERNEKITYLPWYMTMFLRPEGSSEPLVVSW